MYCSVTISSDKSSFSIADIDLSALSELPDSLLNVQPQQPQQPVPNIQHTIQQQAPASSVVLTNANTNSTSIPAQHSYLSGLLTSPNNGPIQRPVQPTNFNASPRHPVYPPQRPLNPPRPNHSITPQNLRQQLELPPTNQQPQQQQQNNVSLQIQVRHSDVLIKV